MRTGRGPGDRGRGCIVADQAYAAPKFEQRRVSVRLSAADWAWFDRYIKFGSEPDDRAVSWTVAEYVKDERHMAELRAKRDAQILQEPSDAQK